MRHGGSTCSSPRGPSARAWAARIGLDDGRLRDGRSSVEGLSAAALPGFPSPRLTFADRLRGDKAPDVLIEILALIDASPPAYLVGDGPLRGPLTRLIRARGLEAVVHLPGWSYEPARDIAQATVHVVPHARSRGRKSAVLALGLGVPVVGTAAVRPAVLPGGIAACTGSSSFGILSFLSPRCEMCCQRGRLPRREKPVQLPVAGHRDIQPAPPPVLPAGASPGSTVLPGTMRLPPAARVTSTRRARVFGDAGMVTCRTPSA
jgi:hypothetical protein